MTIGEHGIEVVDEKAEDGAVSPSRVVRGAERVAGSAIEISTDMDEESRMTQAALGLAMVVGGILLFLLSIVITRYAGLGAKRYLQMNMALLRGG
ncbi:MULTISPECIES: hypothetical protein [unclassified Massilia]|uniref:hypothetical protein n=1 Tax=unclassified Massilia TaxID=2609279 RepID=UPI001E4E22DB|nr:MULTISPECIES: hypothetical protein [unclassified Massilia]